ncbi:MAG: hypothetical protein Q4F67_00340 [Propionibacteriaceae bacterium]|nr:hypothetical protein [Propionibacteriaceae bacterium]
MRAIVSAGAILVLLSGCSLLGPTPVPAPAPTPPAPPPGATAAPTTPSPAATAPSAAPLTSPEAPTPEVPESDLRSSFTGFAAGERGELSIALAAVGGSGTPTVLGDLDAPVAWSTAKVPLAIAVERTPGAEALRPTMRRAITASDNEAAIQLWQSLGQPATAAAATDGVLRDFGDPTTRTQSQQVRPPYTAFGQTRWTLADQARFAAQLPCRAEAGNVYAAMGQIIPGQSWGLGQLPSAHYKGGWGPSATGHLVRQFGVIDVPGGQVAVAMAVTAPGFDQGTATLSRAAQWLGEHVDALPAGSC